MLDGHRKKKDSIFLNERFMAAVCIFVVAAIAASMVLCASEGEPFSIFELLVKLVTAVGMYMAFRYFKWDVAKGLMGGVLFCLMYQEAYLVLGQLWGEGDFDTYLVAGIQGSIYLAASGMALLMTVIISVNHFFINFANHGNPKDVILNRIAILFKFGVYLLLLAANSQLGLPRALLLKNAMQYVTDIALLLLLATIESQFDSFNALRQELLQLKRERRSVT